MNSKKIITDKYFLFQNEFRRSTGGTENWYKNPAKRYGMSTMLVKVITNLIKNK